MNNTTVKSATKSAGEDRFGREFYNKPCEELAKALLGQTLVRIKDTGDCLKARIVETEAYLGKFYNHILFQTKKCYKNKTIIS